MAADQDRCEKDLPEGSIFVPKPYSPAQIIRTLRELTDNA
jgi:hypothetical protein